MWLDGSRHAVYAGAAALSLRAAWRHCRNHIRRTGYLTFPGLVDIHIVLLQNISQDVLQIVAGAYVLIARIHLRQFTGGGVALPDDDIKNRGGAEFVLAARSELGTATILDVVIGQRD